MEIWKKSVAPFISGVVVNERMVCLFIGDGSALSVSLSLFAELVGAPHEPLRDCQIVDDGQAVYWPQLDKKVLLSQLLDD